MATLLYGNLNGGAGVASGDGEFVGLGLPVFLRHLSTSFDTHVKSILSSVNIYGASAMRPVSRNIFAPIRPSPPGGNCDVEKFAGPSKNPPPSTKRILPRAVNRPTAEDM